MNRRDLEEFFGPVWNWQVRRAVAQEGEIAEALINRLSPRGEYDMTEWESQLRKLGRDTRKVRQAIFEE